jgi:hypothetical protein
MTVQGAAVLQSLLSELASILLPRGMTPKRFSELARYAFVQAAADTTKLRNGRVNHSRVAAQTGLTRADVKRLLSRNGFEPSKGGKTAVERVIHGWRTDREFAVSPGRTKALQIAGPKGSFARLVKKYGGDVPHRAILDELRRIGAVRDSGDVVQLRRSLNFRQRNNYKFLSLVLPVLIDGLRVASKWDGSNVSSVQRLTIPAETEMDLITARERCASAGRSMLDGLADSFDIQVGVSRKGRPPTHFFSITILLSENRAKEKSTHRSLPRKRSVQD